MRDRFLHPLVDRARDYFQDFKDHPAVMSTDKIFQMMWCFVFNYAALYYSEFPEAQLIGVIPPEYKEWKSMDKMITIPFVTDYMYYLQEELSAL